MLGRWVRPLLVACVPLFVGLAGCAGPSAEKAQPPSANPTPRSTAYPPPHAVPQAPYEHAVRAEGGSYAAELVINATGEVRGQWRIRFWCNETNEQALTTGGLHLVWPPGSVEPLITFLSLYPVLGAPDAYATIGSTRVHTKAVYNQIAHHPHHSKSVREVAISERFGPWRFVVADTCERPDAVESEVQISGFFSTAELRLVPSIMLSPAWMNPDLFLMTDHGTTVRNAHFEREFKGSTDLITHMYANTATSGVMLDSPELVVRVDDQEFRNRTLSHRDFLYDRLPAGMLEIELPDATWLNGQLYVYYFLLENDDERFVRTVHGPPTH